MNGCRPESLLAASLLLALAGLTGCGSSNDGGSGGQGVCPPDVAGCEESDGGGGGGGGDAGLPACDYTMDGTHSCFFYSSVSSELTSSGELNSVFGEECTGALGGKVVSACPTAGQTGCCENIPAPEGLYSTAYCTYDVPSSMEKSTKAECTTMSGTWKQ